MERRLDNSHELRNHLLASCFVLLVILSVTRIVFVNAATETVTLPKYVTEYTTPTVGAAPLAISVGKNGIVWFTESNASKIGKFDPVTNSFTEYSIPGVGDMWGIVLDQGGYVWFTQYSGKGSVNPGGQIVSGGKGRLGRLDPLTGNLTFVNISTIGSFPMRLVVDAQNRIWFTELLGNRTGVYDQTANQLTEYQVSTNLTGPADLTFDNQGALWFTESYAQRVVQFFPQNHTYVEYPFGTDVFSPVGIAVDKSGNVWIADHGGNWIAEFDPLTRSLIRIPTHTVLAGLTIPNGIAVDALGRVWFTEHVGNSIGYFDPQSKTMVEFPIPTGPISTTLWLAIAPNGDVWFTEWSANKIGVVHARLPVPISLQPSQSQLQLQVGGQTSINLKIRNSQDIGPNATFQYSLASYNTKEVSADFSPQSLTLSGVSDSNVKVQVQIPATARLGNYTLGLGLDAGTVRVWSIIQVQALKAPGGPSAQTLVTLLPLAVLLGAAFAILVYYRKRTNKAVT